MFFRFLRMIFIFFPGFAQVQLIRYLFFTGKIFEDLIVNILGKRGIRTCHGHTLLLKERTKCLHTDIQFFAYLE